MSTPIYTVDEARDRETFLALMWSLSYPGRVHILPSDAGLALVGQALLDLETSFHTPDDTLETQLLRTGARALAPDKAAYHFYPRCDDTALATMKLASKGSLLYPDTAATLIVHAALGRGQTYRLSGPGIQTTQTLQVDLPEQFWRMRAGARFPLGWDVFIIDGEQVVGLPRSTRIQE